MKRSILCLVLLLVSAEIMIAQVTISPTAVFISQDRFGSFVVINNSAIAQEVTIDFVQTYPASDSLGNVSVRDASEKADDFKLITDWIRSFPRTFVLEPAQRQTVRLTVRPGNTLEDGTYWTRLRVTSSPQSAEIGATETERVATSITIKFEQIISGFYKIGTVSTGVNVNGVRAIKTDVSKLIVFNYALTGNSPFIGTIEMDVLNGNGQSVHKGRVVTSLYDDGSRNFMIPETEVPAGNYSVVLTFMATRPDIPNADVIPMETVTQRFNVTVP
jgi:hypothetical protein